MPHLHVTLVSERPEISLIPLLQLRPQRVVLVTPAYRLAVAERLRILLAHELPTTTDIRIRSDLPPTWEPDQVSTFAAALAEELRCEQAEDPELTVTYDLAGTSRLSALLIQHVMHRCRADWLHVDVAAGTLYRLGPEFNPTTLETHAIEPVLGIDLYLLANGRKRIKARSDSAHWRKAAMARQPLTRYLAHHVDRLGEWLSELAGLVHGATGEAVLHPAVAANGLALNPHGQHQQLARPPGFPATEALRQLHDAGLLEWSNDAPRSLVFSSLDGARYLGGEWLAEQAWHDARQAGFEAHCLAHVLDLSGRHNDAPAVFGCLALHHNQLLVIDGLVPAGDREAQVRQAQHHLHALVEHSASMAATRVLLGTQAFDDLRERALRLGIQVRGGVELKRLEVDLRQWRESGRWPEA